MENSSNGIKINLGDMPWVSCGGNYLFETVMMFKRVSPIVSPSGREEMVPVEVMLCKACGKVPQFMAERIPGLPAELICNTDGGTSSSV
jgi:hypothetical protein